MRVLIISCYFHLYPYQTNIHGTASGVKCSRGLRVKRILTGGQSIPPSESGYDKISFYLVILNYK